MPRDKVNQIHGVVLDLIAEENTGPAPVFTVETDFGYPIVLCVYERIVSGQPAYVWYQLWVLEKEQTLLDAPFGKFRPERLEHVTQVAIPSVWGGSVFRRFDDDFLDELVRWLDDHDGSWSVRACAAPPRADFGNAHVLHHAGDRVPFEFSFDNLVTATEFKLRWG